MKTLYSLLIITCTFSTTFVTAQNLSDSLLAYYKFDGNTLDQSSNGFDLETTSGSITYDSFSYKDSAIVFDGSSSIAMNSTFDNSSATSMTVSLWIKTNTINTIDQTCFQAANTGFALMIEANTGKAKGFFKGSSIGAYTSNKSIADDQWHNLLIQSDGSKTSMYIDGVFDGSKNEPLVVGSNGQLVFGKSVSVPRPFTGLLNEVRVYDRYLSALEIDLLYEQGTPLSVANKQLTDSLKAHYKFEGNLLDESKNKFDLELATGNISYDVFNDKDSAIVFDGQSSISMISNFDNSNATSMTVSLWLKSNNIASIDQTCMQAANTGFALMIEANSGKAKGFFKGSSIGAYTSTKSIVDGLWHNILIQNDGSKTSMYIDGVLDGSINEPLVVGENGSLGFGKSLTIPRPFTGLLNEVRVYDRYLPESEIKLIYEKDVPSLVTSNKKTHQVTTTEVYPNPTNQSLKIDLNNVYNDINVELTDLLGNTIQNDYFSNTNTFKLNLDTPAGIYLLTIKMDDKIFTQKVIKE